ncbi:MAG: hypothetical protein FJX76_19310 [Armatimonadetes bacterium]|nr:hypothetical protein [Armatimonadota bacterium]
MAEMSLDQMREQKKASCPVCSSLNDYSQIQFNDWTKCSTCDTPMVLVKIDNIIFFLRHGWT